MTIELMSMSLRRFQNFSHGKLRRVSSIGALPLPARFCSTFHSIKQNSSSPRGRERVDTIAGGVTAMCAL